MNRHQVFGLALFGVVLSGCDPVRPVEPTKVEGSWMTSCVQGATDSLQFSFEASGESFQYTAEQFKDRYCAEPFYALFQYGSFKDVAAVAADPNDPNSVAIPETLHFTFEHSTLSPLTDEAATFFNTGAGLCGFDQWTKESEIIVDGYDCGSGFGAIPASGQVLKQIYSLSGQDLYFGLNSDSDLQLAPKTLPTSNNQDRLFHLAN